MEKRGNKLRVSLYFSLVILLLTFLIIHAFKIVELETGFFTRFLLSMLFVLLLLPMVPHIKIFDIVDIKRGARILTRKK